MSNIIIETVKLSRKGMSEPIRASYNFAGGGVVLCLVLMFAYFYFRKHYIIWNCVLEVFVSIAPNLIAVLLIYWISQILFKTRADYHRAQAIRNLMEAGQIHEGFLTSGITAIHPNIKAAEPEKLVNAALANGQNVQILATMMAENIITQDSFRLAKDRNCNITIILLNPDSQAAKQRSGELKVLKYTKDSNGNQSVDEDYVCTAIKRTVQELRADYNNSCANNIQANDAILTIHYIDSIPGLYLNICGDQALVGFFCYSQKATEGPMLNIKDIPEKCDGTAKTFPELVRREFDEAERRAKEKTNKP